jgi:hypothetical protein
MIEAGILRVQAHPGVTIKCLAGVDVSTDKLVVQERGQSIPVV